MKLSIIIVNYNVRYFLEQCIDSCLKAMDGMEAELIVMDNASKDGSREMMQEKFQAVAYHYLNENLGFSKANNRGIEHSTGEYVLLLNPDTVVGEDTFKKCVAFMDSHADAGGLGVHMIDGKGKFLPESKRGLPTPEAAFYKMTGLSSFFPRSKRFGAYHLGYLGEHETNEVQILSGAFMLIRKAALEKCGLLDEDFFMYGEDIDLSYRIVKAGYKNYYFSDTSIIHYKGESTKKGSANYVFVFYRAMVIFAQKHFSRGQASALSLFINLAIYLRALIALMSRILGRYWQLLLDAGISYAVFASITHWYGQEFSKDFNLPFVEMALPAYVVILMFSLVYGGAYDNPYRLGRLVGSWVAGMLALLAVYSLLPESYRFSRAILLLGSGAGLLAAMLWRGLLHVLPFRYSLTARAPERRLVVSDTDGFQRTLGALKALSIPTEFIAGVSSTKEKAALPINFVSTLTEITKACDELRIEEVVMDADQVSFSDIIETTKNLNTKRPVEFKIASQQGSLFIGSQTVWKAGRYEQSMHLKSTHLQRVQREKRTLDLVVSCMMMVCSPFLILVADSKAGFLLNLWSVTIGKKSWVGYDPRGRAQNLPLLKASILHPNTQVILPDNARSRALKANWQYISGYSVLRDMRMIWHHLPLLGSR